MIKQILDPSSEISAIKTDKLIMKKLSRDYLLILCAHSYLENKIGIQE